MTARGLLLAAGAGRRMGRPKALVGDWLVDSLAVLAHGGCDGVTVVLGARAEEARRLVPTGVDVVVCDAWADGMGASLTAGLGHLEVAAGGGSGPVAALVHLVDLPDVGADVVRRVLAGPIAPTTLRRATYDGTPGHPVLLGRDHWDGARQAARGDRGARDHLAAHDPEPVECGDLAHGRDQDTNQQRTSQT